MWKEEKIKRVCSLVLVLCMVFFAVGCTSIDDYTEKNKSDKKEENQSEPKTATPTVIDTVTGVPELTEQVPTPTVALSNSPTPIPTDTPIPTSALSYTLDYTSNDDETAKNGNSGEFSYRLYEQNVSYEEYLVFDFDSGYAYFWQLGDGSQFYVRYSIAGGDLNSGVKVVGYLSSDNTYTMNIQCKYSGNLGLLSGVDSSGDSFELTGIKLEDAHNLMNQRMMVDASKVLKPVETPTPTAVVKKELDFTNNDEEKALQGDSGLFAYSNIETTGTYAYIIIDFDNKYVFYFSDDEEDEYYEQFTIESGNLRDGVECSAYYPDATITWNVKFRGENNPNEIEIKTSTGKSAWVRRTNLNDALELLKTKKLYVEEPNETPIDTPTPEPTNTPLPTNTPTPTPTNTPTPSPTPLPTNTPTPKPTSTPTPTPKPTSTPTPTPKEKSLDFTTNSEKKAKEGNSGVFSYKRDNSDTSSPEYIIIDFDKMLVDMIFHEGKKESTARMQLVSGDLNTYILVACYTPGSVSYFGIEFTYEQNPEEVIVTTQAGGQTRYTHTNLYDAIKKLDSIKMYDLSKP